MPDSKRKMNQTTSFNHQNSMNTPKDQRHKKAYLSISGMTCASCVARIEKGIRNVSGVKDAHVNLATERAEMVFNPREVDEKDIAKIIEDLGYKVIPPQEDKLTLSVGGMTCAACVNRVEKALRSLPGVREANVNFATEKATVTYQADLITKKDFREAIEEQGYEVRGFEDEGRTDREAEARKQEIQVLRRRFIISAVLTFLIMLGSMPEWFPWVPNFFQNIGSFSSWRVPFSSGPGHSFIADSGQPSSTEPRI